MSTQEYAPQQSGIEEEDSGVPTPHCQITWYFKIVGEWEPLSSAEYHWWQCQPLGDSYKDGCVKKKGSQNKLKVMNLGKGWVGMMCVLECVKDGKEIRKDGEKE